MKMNTTGMRRLIPYLKKYRFKITGAILLIVAASCLIALSPTLEGMITTQLFQDVTAGHGVDFTVIYRIVATLLLVYVTGAICNCSYQFLLTDAIQSAMVDLRNDVESKIRRLPIAYFDQHPLGDTMSRVTNDMETISNALQQSFAQILNAILGLTLAVAMMFSIQWKMALASMLIIIGSVVISKMIVKKSQPLFEKQQNSLGSLSGVVQESFTGFNEIKLFGKQEDALADFMAANSELCQNGFKAQFISGLMSPLVSFITYVGIGCIAIMGALYALSGVIAVGQLQAFIRYIWQINDPLSQVSQLSSQVQSAYAAMNRIFTLLNETEEVQKGSVKIDVSQIQGNVTFDHVQFGYTDELLMKDVSFQVQSGQMVAIVGPTGAGKTTLMNLLLRFYDVNGGSIKIDGIDIRDMDRSDLRSLFSLVLQDTWLFSGSIFENIRYGSLTARKDEVVDAAKMANIHHYISTLSHGYDSMINEESNNISQGEKQLLTIARAILKNPRILILDEATSAVDTRLERMLQDAMQKVMAGRTSFVIAHRLSTIRNADLILVVDNGNIIEQGTHEELLRKNGTYQKLYHSQFANRETITAEE